jgi:amino acid permease
MFALAATAIGAGCLATPKVLEYLGIILGIIMIVFCALMVRLSMRVLVGASDQARVYLYPDLVKQVLGQKWGIGLEVIIILYVFGVLISY